MNVEIGIEAAQFPEKEYINAIFFAVRYLWGGGGAIAFFDHKQGCSHLVLQGQELDLLLHP